MGVHRRIRPACLLRALRSGQKRALALTGASPAPLRALWPRLMSPRATRGGAQAVGCAQSRYRIWSVQSRSRRCSDLLRLANSSFEMPPTCSTVLTCFSIQRVDDAADLLALRGQADADRATINARALMIEEAHLHELLQIVGHVGARDNNRTGAQFAGGQLLVADIVCRATEPAPN